MARPKNMSEVIKLQTRWKRLGAFIGNVSKELHRSIPNSQRKSTVVICGRIINKIVCTFAISDSITTRTLQELNTHLMRLDKPEDITTALALEAEIVNSLLVEITNTVNKLGVEIDAAKAVTS